eukprot:CAMPEP_0167763062 /NCGR_PEP_ID=MMETSP0110_2-20121227/13136_1 /TAXON_ID=629695 /ORGANISM="Gymnochlora sp., Strain CCMP2014" /LENGTH=360 /DNA_ID=CAMNT_0007650049 /DNA_START=123 /DNA_END=1205 /DNA_ORIENTATION=+
MPKLKAKIEGRGNGIRTVVINLRDVAKALNCPPAFPTKFFGFELGAQSKWDAKSERASVNGAHTAPDLQKILSKFVSIFILCPKCGLPEIKWNVTKNGIKIDCAACGHNGMLNTGHKLLTYILKQKSSKKKGGGSKKERREKKDRQKKGSKSSSVSKVKSSKKEEEYVFETESSQAAVEERKKKEFAQIMKGRANVSAVSAKDSPVLVLRDYIKTKKPTEKQILAELKRLKLSRSFSETEKFKILLETVIDVTKPPSTVVEQFAKNKSLLTEVVTNEQSANLVLLCIEELVGVVEKKLLPRTPMILQQLYDDDILEEEDILKWSESPPETSLISRGIALEVRKAAAPFIKWLQEADEEDD